MTPPIRPPRIALPGDRPGEAWSELQRAQQWAVDVYACKGRMRIRRRFIDRAAGWVEAASAGWVKVQRQEEHMGWANDTIRALEDAGVATCRPHGRSMEPHIHSGQEVKLEQCSAEQAQVGDILLCRVGGAQYLHFCRGKQGKGAKTRCMIANAQGRQNGWTSQVYGRVFSV